MIDVSWGETFVILGISIAAIGRKDLPKASRFFGNKVGRVVGLLQGARARADRFAQKNELNALQNELRSGLRELVSSQYSS
jgi:Sec-independent protein translocase protein TatA